MLFFHDDGQDGIIHVISLQQHSTMKRKKIMPLLVWYTDTFHVPCNVFWIEVVWMKRTRQEVRRGKDAYPALRFSSQINLFYSWMKTTKLTPTPSTRSPLFPASPQHVIDPVKITLFGVPKIDRPRVHRKSTTVYHSGCQFNETNNFRFSGQTSSK